MITEAANRLLASQKGVEQLYNSLEIAGRKYLLCELPRLLTRWYYDNSSFKRDRWLKLAAARYNDTNSLAVALLHLKQYYPVALPHRLYRLTNLGYTDIPDNKIVTLEKGTALRPLISFTNLRNPVVEDRNNQRGDVVLEWKPIGSLILANYKTLSEIARDALEFISVNKESVQRELGISISVPKNRWMRARGEISGYSNEQEYLVYLSKPIKCTWREYKVS